MFAYAHEWGISAGADRVWCQVNGLAPAKAAKRLLMVWQAFMDESVDEGLFVLAGYVAPAENWARLAGEWEQMLPYGCLGSDGRYRFKMSEMAQLPERMERVPRFYRIIERHIPVSLSITLPLKDFHAGKRRIFLLDAKKQPQHFEGGAVDNIYVFAFTRLMHMFNIFLASEEAKAKLPADEKIDFIFDDRAEKKAILAAWEEFQKRSPYPEKYGATPRFGNDDDFLPLQAADFIAWWVRRWHNEEIEFEDQPFPWKTHRDLYWIQNVMTEDHVADDVAHIVRVQCPPGDTVFDRKDLLTVPVPTWSGREFRQHATLADWQARA
jgi:hypothetical protein